MVSNIDQTGKRIREGGIIAIIRGDFAADKILAIGEVLLTSGISVLEVALNSSRAFDAIAALQTRFSEELLVGAGTVCTLEQVDEAIRVGAKFIVSPNLDLAVVAQAQARSLLHLPGVFTPTEALQASAAGTHLLKLFPAEAGGPAYLKALLAPLSDLAFVPIGGVSATNLADYITAGAVAVGVGSALIGDSQQSLAETARKATELRRIWERANHD